MIQNIRRSLTDLLGAEYTAAVCRARAALTGESPEALRAVADEKVDFYPEAFARRQEELMGEGKSLIGIVEGDSNPKLFIPQLISYYKQGKFPFDKLIRVFEFDEINEAFEASHSGKAIKALLKMR